MPYKNRLASVLGAILGLMGINQISVAAEAGGERKVEVRHKTNIVNLITTSGVRVAKSEHVPKELKILAKSFSLNNHAIDVELAHHVIAIPRNLVSGEQEFLKLKNSIKSISAVTVSNSASTTYEDARNDRLLD